MWQTPGRTQGGGRSALARRHAMQQDAQQQHVGGSRRDASAVRSQGLTSIARAGLAVLVMSSLQGADAKGRGIPAMVQLNKTHVSHFNLPGRLTADSPICLVGTGNRTEFDDWWNPVRTGPWGPEGKAVGEIGCCDDRGLLLPLFPYEYLWNKNLRAFLYIVSLLWCFVGVSVLADCFMAGIEAVTAWTTSKQVPRTHRDGRPVTDRDGKQIIDTVEEPMWNEKVACLTLFALGSSAPEIIIACFGCLPEFYEDALGPGTVVGSATFNLYVILGLCMVALEPGEFRKIDGLSVHIIQAICSLWAYAWLFICLIDDVVTIGEAFITFLFFPLLVFIVWACDRNWFMGSKVSPEEEIAADVEAGADATPATAARASMLSHQGTLADITATVVHSKIKMNYIQRRREAIQSSTGAKNKILKTMAKDDQVKTDEESMVEHLILAQEEAKGVTATPVFLWEFVTFHFDKGAPLCTLKILRLGKTDCPATVRVRTKDGNVAAGSAYVSHTTAYHFKEGETSHSVGVDVMPDYAWGKGAHFFAEMFTNSEDPVADIPARHKVAKVQLSNTRKSATYVWTDTSCKFYHGDSHAVVYLQRLANITMAGKVKVKTREGTALADQHFKPLDEMCEFEAGVTARQIKVELLKDWPASDAESLEFFVDIFEHDDDKGTEEGHEIKIELVPKKSDKGVNIADLDEMDEPMTWMKQFANALSVNGGEDLEDSTIMDGIMHYASVGWKVFAAIIPPAHIGGGLPCFFCALILVGFCSTLISDFASIFGCLVGMTDTVTSISLVALGTSLPDTFASMLAIKADDNADNAIGNVTGSNSVNVFLGLGLPWIFSSIYWETGKTASREGAAWFDKWKATYGPGSAAYANCWGGCDGNGQSKGWLKYQETGAFVVQKGKLGPSLVLYVVLSLLAMGFISVRRYVLGGEIGGNSGLMNALSAVFMVSLWIIYLMLVSLQDYGYGVLDALMF